MKLAVGVGAVDKESRVDFPRSFPVHAIGVRPIIDEVRMGW